jgi:hypothetical protein
MDWWEKTVEYLFVLKYFNYDAIIAPMDGNHERIGDAIYSKDSRFVLIEFKRTEAEIENEVDKFIDYETARNALHDRDAHHYFVYGRLENDLKLECKTYFSHNKPPDVSDALLSGVDMDTFKNYAKALLGYKIPPKGGGGLSFDDYMQVACIRNDGLLICCMSFSDFLPMIGLEGVAEKSLDAKVLISR